MLRVIGLVVVIVVAWVWIAAGHFGPIKTAVTQWFERLPGQTAAKPEPDELKPLLAESKPPVANGEMPSDQHSASEGRAKPERGDPFSALRDQGVVTDAFPRREPTPPRRLTPGAKGFDRSWPPEEPLGTIEGGAGAGRTTNPFEEARATIMSAIELLEGRGYATR